MKTEDMIMNKPLPGFTGFGSIATNIGGRQHWLRIELAC